jgi:hypothetical protein
MSRDARAIVSQDFLLKHLNDDLQKQEGCEKCFFTGVTRLGETDEEGCNWSASTMRVTGASVLDYEPGARTVVQAAREKFNLE